MQQVQKGKGEPSPVSQCETSSGNGFMGIKVPTSEMGQGDLAVFCQFSHFPDSPSQPALLAGSHSLITLYPSVSRASQSLISPVQTPAHLFSCGGPLPCPDTLCGSPAPCTFPLTALKVLPLHPLHHVKHGLSTTLQLQEGLPNPTPPIT